MRADIRNMTHQIRHERDEVEQENEPRDELLSIHQRIYSQRREAWYRTEWLSEQGVQEAALTCKEEELDQFEGIEYVLANLATAECQLSHLRF